MRWIYDSLNAPTEDELNRIGSLGWEVYWTDGTLYKLKKQVV